MTSSLPINSPAGPRWTMVRLAAWFFFALSVLALLLGLIGPQLVQRYVIFPRASLNPPGWRIERYASEEPGKVWASWDRQDNDAYLRADKERPSLWAFAVWDVREPGLWQMDMRGLGRVRFYIDGEKIISFCDPEEGQHGDALPDLEAGLHFLAIEMETGQGAHVTLETAPPGQAHLSPLDPGQLRFINLSNIADYWKFIKSSRALALGGLACLPLTAILLAWSGALGLKARARLLKTVSARDGLGRRMATRWAWGVSLGILVFLPAIFLPSPPPKEPFDPTWLHQLNAYKPHIICIGNSMCDSRVNPGVLESLIPGRRVYRIWFPGSLPREWYLMMKHYVEPTKASPDTVVIFFNEIELTNPWRDFPHEAHRTQCEKLCPDPEKWDPVFQEIIFGHQDMQQMLTEKARGIFPASYYGAMLREWVEGAALTLSIPAEWVYRMRPEWRLGLMRNAVNDRLHYANFRPVYFRKAEPRLDRKVFDFERMLPGSFLPHIIESGRRKGVRLIFVRVQHRPKDDGRLAPVPPEVKAYLEKLRAYLEREGCLYHDFTGDPEITLDMYGEGDHIKPGEARDKWTRNMYQRIGDWLK